MYAKNHRKLTRCKYFLTIVVIQKPELNGKEDLTGRQMNVFIELSYYLFN